MAQPSMSAKLHAHQVFNATTKEEVYVYAMMAGTKMPRTVQLAHSVTKHARLVSILELKPIVLLATTAPHDSEN
jgi:hypothetical protein